MSYIVLGYAGQFLTRRILCRNNQFNKSPLTIKIDILFWTHYQWFTYKTLRCPPLMHNVQTMRSVKGIFLVYLEVCSTV